MLENIVFLGNIFCNTCWGVEGKKDFELRISDLEKKSFMGNTVIKICWKGFGLASRESQTWEESKRQKMVYKGLLSLAFFI